MKWCGKPNTIFRKEAASRDLNKDGVPKVEVTHESVGASLEKSMADFVSDDDSTWKVIEREVYELKSRLTSLDWKGPSE